jgi:hypothetical protein
MHPYPKTAVLIFVFVLLAARQELAGQEVVPNSRSSRTEVSAELAVVDAATQRIEQIQGASKVRIADFRARMEALQDARTNLLASKMTKSFPAFMTNHAIASNTKGSVTLI